MADIKLTNLGDIPVVEPDDSTYLLAEQDGAYARVPKDKVGGSGGGALEVVIDPNSDQKTGTASVDVVTVLDAIEAGKWVYAALEVGSSKLILPLLMYAESAGYVAFGVINASANLAYTIAMQSGTDCAITMTAFPATT